jgi:hypothetical protein
MRRSWVFDQMVSRGVFVGLDPDRSFMNGEAAKAFLVAQRRQGLTGAGILLVVFVIVLLASAWR